MRRKIMCARIEVFFIIIALLLLPIVVLLPTVFSQEFQEFDEIENPTADDLLLVSNPTSDDFSRLSGEEQQQYLLNVYNADFASQYLTENGFNSKEDRVIAERHYTDSPEHINDDPAGFIEYMDKRGIEIILKGPVNDYSDGVLTGTNQKISLGSYEKTAAKDDYRIVVGSDGTIFLQTKSGGRAVRFTGTLQPQSTGKFTLDQGTINDVAIKNGKNLEFNNEGNIDAGTVTSYGTITFSESTVIKTESMGALILHNAKIQSMGKGAEGSYRVIAGSIVVEDYDAIEGEIRVASGKTLKINEVTLKAKNEPVVVEIDDQWWFEKYADPIAAAFKGETEGSYAQFIKRDNERIIETQGDLEIGMNAQEFVTGTASESEQSEFQEFNFKEAKNGVAYKKGDAGEQVKMIQTLLMTSVDPETGKPYLSPTYTTSSGKVLPGNDGAFGSLTEEAVKAWQEDQGINADGKFGKGSLYIAEEAMKGTENVEITTTGKTVMSTDGTQLRVSMRDADLKVQGYVYSATAEQPLLVATTEHKGEVGFPIDIEARDTGGDVREGISTAYRDCSVGTEGTVEYICQGIVEGEETLGSANALSEDYLLDVAEEQCSKEYTRRGEALCTTIVSNEKAVGVVKKIVKEQDFERPQPQEQAFVFPSIKETEYSEKQRSVIDRLSKLGLSEPETVVSVVYSSAEQRAAEFGLPQEQAEDIGDLTLAIAMQESYMGESKITAAEEKLWRENQYATLEDATGIIPDRVSLGPMQVQIASAKENAELLGYEFSAKKLTTFEGGIEEGQIQATKLWKEYEGEAETFQGKIELVATAYNVGEDAPRIAAIQQALSDQGYPMEIDGMEGRSLTQALKQFSEDSGIPYDEYVSEHVLDSWTEKYGTEAPTAIPLQTDYVTRIVRYCTKITGRCSSPLSS